jgi:hypothetical protein
MLITSDEPDRVRSPVKSDGHPSRTRFVGSEHDKRAQSACAVKTHYKTTMAVHIAVFIVAYYKTHVKGIIQIGHGGRARAGAWY